MKKMRGVIDPWTLGFIISLFGGVTGYILHPPGEQKNIEPNQMKQKTTITINKTKTVVSEQ